MEVDPDVLRQLASQVDNASADVENSKLADHVRDAGDGLSGSSIQWACETVGGMIRTKMDAYSYSVGLLGSAVKGTAHNFKVTDEEFIPKTAPIFSKSAPAPR